MTNSESPEKTANLHSEKKLVAFVEALSRIFKVGIYYPEGHAVLDQATLNCLQLLQDITTTSNYTRIQVTREYLHILKAKVPENTPAVKEFRLLLTKLGISAIEIDRKVSVRQLLFLVKNLLAWRMKLESAKSLITFNVANLPSTIRLEQQEFLVDEASIIDGDSETTYNQNLEEICAALGQQGLDTEQVDQCRNLLQKLSSPAEGNMQSVKDFPNATWKDVQTLIYKVITGSFISKERRFDPSAANDINIISTIFENLELNVTDKKYRDTIKFLVAHLVGRKNEPIKEKLPEEKKEKKLRKLLNKDQILSIDEIKTFVYKNSVPLKILKKIPTVDNSELISIVFQLISPDQNKKITRRLENELTTRVADGVNDREKKVLIAGLKNLAEAKNFKYFRHLLKKIVQKLRDSEESNSLDFIVALWGKMPSSLHVLLWPFVVNELLMVGNHVDGEKFLEATEIASHMHADGMKRLTSHLEELDSFSKKKIAGDIFKPSYTFSYKLFSFLYRSSIGGIVGQKIIAGLLAEPQDDLIKAIGPMLELSNPAHVEFLHGYLAYAQLKEPPLALKMAAGKILEEYIENISEENKNQPWLGTTIILLAGLQIKDIKTILQRIIKEKKMGLLPAWPKPCRLAADSGLKMLNKRKSLTELL